LGEIPLRGGNLGGLPSKEREQFPTLFLGERTKFRKGPKKTQEWVKFFRGVKKFKKKENFPRIGFFNGKEPRKSQRFPKKV